MTNKEIYSNMPGKWPRVLQEEERKRLFEAAKCGEESEKNILLLASMLYLGLSVDEVIKIRFCTVCGDAIENRKRGAFLHIPNEYRKMVFEIVKNRENIQLKERLIECTKKEAENLIIHIFIRAGIDTEFCFMRIKRTAAHLHYINGWTWSGNIERWFFEMGFIKSIDKSAYYMGASITEFSLL